MTSAANVSASPAGAVAPTEVYYGERRILAARSPTGPDSALGWGWEALAAPNNTWAYLRPLNGGIDALGAWFGFEFEATNASTPPGPDRDWSGYSCDDQFARIVVAHPASASTHAVVDKGGGAFYKNGFFQFASPTAAALADDGGASGPAGARYFITGLGSGCGAAMNASGRFGSHLRDGKFVFEVTELPGANMSAPPSPACAAGGWAQSPPAVVPARVAALTLSGVSHVTFSGLSFRHASGDARVLCDALRVPCDALGNGWLQAGAVTITAGSSDVLLVGVDVSLNGGLGVLIEDGAANVVLQVCACASRCALYTLLTVSVLIAPHYLHSSSAPPSDSSSSSPSSTPSTNRIARLWTMAAAGSASAQASCRRAGCFPAAAVCLRLSRMCSSMRHSSRSSAPSSLLRQGCTSAEARPTSRSRTPRCETRPARACSSAA